MAYEIDGAVKFSTLVANADLSTTGQYLFVKITGGKIDVCSGTTDIPVGILQNKPKAGEAAEVTVIGISKLVAAGALATIGTQIGTDAAGKAVALVNGTDTTKYPVATQLSTSGGANEIITVLVNACNPHRGA